MCEPLSTVRCGTKDRFVLGCPMSQPLHEEVVPFQHVGGIVEFKGNECDWNHRAKDDPYRWLLIQARTDLALPVTPAERRRGVRREMDVLPLHVVAFETEPGDGCESANFGLCRY